MRGLYVLILSTFILRAAFTALSYDTDNKDWWIFFDGQETTAQWAFWRLMILLVEGVLIIAIKGIAYETDPAKKYHCYQMAKLLLWIQGWYIFEYCTHYTSVWITWEQLGYVGNGRAGLSSHILTMLIFAICGRVKK